MKWLIYFLLMFVMLGTFACNKKKKMKKLSGAGYVWMQYDETKCNNPWQFNWLVAPTDEQLAGAVKGNLEGRGITILEMKTSRQEDFVSCEECSCPNGFHYYVRVNQSETPKLKDLKFFETGYDKIPK